MLTETEKFEIRAETFRIMTGYMAPGKDASPQGYGGSPEERSGAWKVWCDAHSAAVNCTIKAMDKVVNRE